jgi:quinoprotein glucose dehydrogenase
LLLLLLTLGHQSSAAQDVSQHSSLTQINPRRVDALSLAFAFHTGNLGMDFAHKVRSFQATPVFWDGRLYVSTSSNSVIAVDGGSGKELWRFDPELDRSIHYFESASRGVAIWHGAA